MLLIRKQKDDEEIISQEFLKACENYIGDLKRGGKLISAQPIEEEDNVVLSKNKTWKLASLNKAKEVIGGYYHLLAKDLEEAIEIAKENPEFAYHPNSWIEIRPIKTSEERSGYAYPNSVEESLSYVEEMEMPF